MDRCYLRGLLQRADDDSEDDGPLRFVIATEGRKADGLNLTMDTLDLQRFQANPVVLYGHQSWGRESLPIGRAENIEIDVDRLLSDTIFDPADPFAQRVDAKYRGGYLNAVSVGFDVFGVDEETGIPHRWELVEYSAVPVPMDPHAIVAGGRARAIETALIDPAAPITDDMREHLRAAIERLTQLLDPPGTPPPAEGRPVAVDRLHLEQLQRVAAS